MKSPFGRGPRSPVRGQQRSAWLLTTYPKWDDPPSRGWITTQLHIGMEWDISTFHFTRKPVTGMEEGITAFQGVSDVWTGRRCTFAWSRSHVIIVKNVQVFARQQLTIENNKWFSNHILKKFICPNPLTECNYFRVGADAEGDVYGKCR